MIYNTVYKLVIVKKITFRTKFGMRFPLVSFPTSFIVVGLPIGNWITLTESTTGLSTVLASLWLWVHQFVSSRISESGEESDTLEFDGGYFLLNDG